MSAADNVSSHQLAMFMPAGRIKSEFVPNDARRAKGGGREGVDRMWAGKLWASKQEEYNRDTNEWEQPLYDSIKETGVVREPVLVWHGLPERQPGGEYGKVSALGNGHHRVAAATDIDPSIEIPVRHREY